MLWSFTIPRVAECTDLLPIRYWSRTIYTFKACARTSPPLTTSLFLWRRGEKPYLPFRSTLPFHCCYWTLIQDWQEEQINVIKRGPVRVWKHRMMMSVGSSAEVGLKMMRARMHMSFSSSNLWSEPEKRHRDRDCAKNRREINVRCDHASDMVNINEIWSTHQMSRGKKHVLIPENNYNAEYYSIGIIKYLHPI